MEVIKNKRILALVGIIGLILGCFLPYYNFSLFGYTQSISLWGYWEGKIVLVLTLANALFIFQDVIEQYIPQLSNNWLGNLVRKLNNPKFALIPTILVAIFAISLIIRLDVNSKYIKYGLGFWILWVGIVSLIGHAIFYKKQNTQSQQTENYQQFQQPIQPQQTVNYQQPSQPEQLQQTMNYQQVQQSVQPQQAVNYQQPLQSGQLQQTMNYQRPQQSVQPQINPTKKFCPYCRNQVDVNAETCFMCGNKL